MLWLTVVAALGALSLFSSLFSCSLLAPKPAEGQAAIEQALQQPKSEFSVLIDFQDREELRQIFNGWFNVHATSITNNTHGADEACHGMLGPNFMAIGFTFEHGYICVKHPMPLEDATFICKDLGGVLTNFNVETQKGVCTRDGKQA